MFMPLASQKSNNNKYCKCDTLSGLISLKMFANPQIIGWNVQIRKAKKHTGTKTKSQSSYWNSRDILRKWLGIQNFAVYISFSLFTIFSQFWCNF